MTKNQRIVYDELCDKFEDAPCRWEIGCKCEASYGHDNCILQPDDHDPTDEEMEECYAQCEKAFEKFINTP